MAKRRHAEVVGRVHLIQFRRGQKFHISGLNRYDSRKPGYIGLCQKVLPPGPETEFFTTTKKLFRDLVHLIAGQSKLCHTCSDHYFNDKGVKSLNGKVIW